MDLVFVRHAQPDWTPGGHGATDPALSARGREQATLVAGRLAAGRPISQLLVSPARRAIETAGPIAERTGVAMTVVDDLHELRLPASWDGRPAAELQAILAAARQRPLPAWWDGIEGGESFSAFHARVTTCLEALLGDLGLSLHADGPPELSRAPAQAGRTVVVAHGGTNAVAVGHLLGLPPKPWEWERIALSHAAIARVTAVPLGDRHVLSLRSLNDREHLPRALRSH